MTQAIDHLAASVATRRGTLALGSAAALLGLTQIGNASAGRKGKNKNKNKNKKSCNKQTQSEVAQACGQQVGECTAYFSSTCGSYADPQKCVSVVTTCCAPLAECRFAEMLQCLQTTPVE